MARKYFKCPYCDKKFSREDMTRHLEKMHLDVLPVGFTPLQKTFHIVNNKDDSYRRPCRICRQGTDWDENKGRYNFICNKKSCHDAWVEVMKKTMGEKMGSNRPTATVEGLEKMLANRKISGIYKFTDGGEHSFTGTYERKTLEFMDKVLQIKSEDLTTPGPVLEYLMPDGTKHIYITDIYYIPYNLIIEVKDGGENPNKNQNWKGSRKKQIAKEDWVVNHTDYNYLRLTDNNFGQLLSVFADLKLHLIENNNERVIKINEDATTIGAFPPAGTNQDGVVVVNYLQNNVFAKPDIAVADSPKLEKIFSRDKWDEDLEETDNSILKNSKYSVYFVKCESATVLKTLHDNVRKNIDEDFIYKTVFGHNKYSDDQIKFEENATEIKDYYKSIVETSQKINDYIKGDNNGQPKHN